MILRPSEIRFSQDSIGNTFGNYTLHRGIYIGQTLDDILSGHCNVQLIPSISVIKRNGQWFTSDNRRLWVFQEAEKRGKCDDIHAYETTYINFDKFTTCNEGRSVRVRRDPGGYLWRRTPTITNKSMALKTSHESVYNKRTSSNSKATSGMNENKQTIYPFSQYSAECGNSENKEADLTIAPNVNVQPTQRWVSGMKSSSDLKDSSARNKSFGIKRECRLNVEGIVTEAEFEKNQPTVLIPAQDFTRRKTSMPIKSYIPSSVIQSLSSTIEKQDGNERRENVEDHTETIVKHYEEVNQQNKDTTDSLENYIVKPYHGTENYKQIVLPIESSDPNLSTPTQPQDLIELPFESNDTTLIIPVQPPVFDKTLTSTVSGEHINSNQVNRKIFHKRICIGTVVFISVIVLITIVTVLIEIQ